MYSARLWSWKNYLLVERVFSDVNKEWRWSHRRSQNTRCLKIDKQLPSVRFLPLPVALRFPLHIIFLFFPSSIHLFQLHASLLPFLFLSSLTFSSFLFFSIFPFPPPLFLTFYSIFSNSSSSLCWRLPLLSSLSWFPFSSFIFLLSSSSSSFLFFLFLFRARRDGRFCLGLTGRRHTMARTTHGDATFL